MAILCITRKVLFLIFYRTDTLSYALLAEINTFHQQRVKDMKTAHQHFLQEQITFYQKVSIYFFLKVKGMAVLLKISERRYSTT